LKTPDALAIATAILDRADLVVANDARLEQVEESPLNVWRKFSARRKKSPLVKRTMKRASLPG
jgi:hypothetical protein